MLEYIGENYIDILIQVRDHLFISVLALLAAVVIGIPIGYFASKSRTGERYLTAPFQILRVVPSLAILVILIPIMGSGIKPAMAALTVLAIPPILINTVVGFREVPEFMVECAAGIGMTEREIRRKVRIPMALPMILAGVRTGLVEIIASATLAAKIGAGGLGEIIFTGLGLYRMDLLIIGGVLVALLSLGSGFVFDRFVGILLRYKKP